MYNVYRVLSRLNVKRNLEVESQMTPAFCAKLRAAAEQNRFAVTVVKMLDDSGKEITVRTNGYWFAVIN
jgi:hypothetical protein